ncbi:MAG: hypothetical protein QM756_17505 [Polyangiaceae bacterium]
METIRKKAGSSWSSWPLNNCGGTSTLTFDQSNGISVIAIGTNPSNNADVPWVRDAFGTVRFWRTTTSPNCWAALPPLPFINGGSIGIYNDPSVTPSNLPWVSSGGFLFQRVNNQWVQIDTQTASVGSGTNMVTGTLGSALWIRDFFGAGSWGTDPTWTQPGISRVSAGVFSTGSPTVAEAVVANGKVWIDVSPIAP